MCSWMLQGTYARPSEGHHLACRRTSSPPDRPGAGGGIRIAKLSRCSPFQPGTSCATRSPGINDDVKVLLIDDTGRIKLSRKAAMKELDGQKQAGEPVAPAAQ